MPWSLTATDALIHTWTHSLQPLHIVILQNKKQTFREIEMSLVEPMVWK